MQQKNTRKCIIWVLFMIHLLCASTAAIATITPLEEAQDDYYYSVDFGDAGFAISIPVRYGRRGMTIDHADIKQLCVMESEDGAPFFTFTGIHNESFAKMQVSELSWKDLLPAFEAILEDTSEEPQLVQVKAAKKTLETLSILFPDDEDVWHVAGLRGDWLLVLTLHPANGDKASIELAKGKMEEFINHMLTPSFEFDIVEQIIPENSSICITLPEGMEALVDPYDEYDKTVYLLRESDDPYHRSFIHITTAYREDFIGKTIEQLPEDQVNAAAGIVFLGLGESWNKWLPLDGVPGLWIMEETSPGYGFSHLIYIKDGWLVGVTAMYLNSETTMSMEEMATIQLSIILNLVRGSDEPASREPESVTLLSETGVFEISMPCGYLIYQRLNEKSRVDCLIFNTLEARESYLVSMIKQEDPQLATILDRPDDLAVLTEKFEATMGSRLPVHELVEKGILGESTLLFYGSAEDQAISATYVDGFFLVLGMTVPDRPDNSKAIVAIGNQFVSFTTGN